MKKEDLYNIPKYAGIYLFKNTLNNKCYIGQAVKLRKRLLHHINNLEHSRYDAPIYKAFAKYGLENFELKILKTWHDALSYETKKQLDFWEKYYIEEYNSYGATGYNQTKGGDAGVLGYKFTEEQLKAHSKNASKVANDGRNIIYCFNVETNKVTIATSIAALSTSLGIKFYTGDLRHSLIKTKFILSRNKQDFQRKIATYKSNPESYKTGKYCTKLTEEMLEDIRRGMKEKEFLEKYKVCKKTYYTYKKKII